MTDLTFEQCFNVLGIQNGDTFENARKIYKKQLHRLHPDRFPNDPVAQSTATDKFLHVKKCFQLIEEHYLIYGEMPFITPQDDEKVLEATQTPIKPFQNRHQKTVNQQEKDFLQQASQFNVDSGAYYDAKPHTHHNRNKEKTSSASELGTGIFIICILAYFILNPPTHKFWKKPTEEQQANQQTSVNTSHNVNTSHIKTNNMANTNLNMDLPNMASNLQTTTQPTDRLSEEEYKAKAILSKTQRRLDIQSGRSFTFGSSFKEVAAIHGTPDISQNNTWYYDKSKIVFKDGRVIDWKSDPAYPLATRLK